MKKLIITALSLSLISISIYAKELSKEEKKQIKSQLKEYIKNPQAYKKLIDNYQQTIDSNTSEINTRKGTINQLSANINDLQNKITSLQGQINECKAKPAPVCPPCPDPTAVPAGTVYKIQIGLFKNLDISGYLADPKYFALEKDGDKNRYVISYFNAKEDAEKFITELKKLGVRGAFAAKYQNGQRIIDTKEEKSSSKTNPASKGKKKVPLKEN